MRMESDEHEVLPPKAKQMYQAVLEMISEGDDVGVITVSGITTRAGIGKGTAYEYFKSKEELIGKALEWNFRTQMEDLYETICREEGFHDKVYALLNWLEERVRFGDVFRQTFRLAAVNAGLFSCSGAGLKGSMSKEDYLFWINRVFDNMMEAGFCEGVLNPAGSEYNRRTGIVSQLVVYFGFLKKDKKDLSKIKDQIYQNLLLLNQ